VESQHQWRQLLQHHGRQTAHPEHRHGHARRNRFTNTKPSSPIRGLHDNHRRTLTVTASSSTGSLVGSAATAVASYNLTALGTADWAHWAAAAGRAISTTTPRRLANQQCHQGRRPASYGGYTATARKVIWTTATPTASSTGDDGYLWANNALGAGYSFTVPASTTSHTSTFISVAIQRRNAFRSLSDSSATPLSIPVSSSSNYQDLVKITFNAASVGKLLHAHLYKTQTIGAASGSVDLIAAWVSDTRVMRKISLTYSGSQIVTGPIIGTWESKTTNNPHSSLTSGNHEVWQSNRSSRAACSRPPFRPIIMTRHARGRSD